MSEQAKDVQILSFLMTPLPFEEIEALLKAPQKKEKVTRTFCEVCDKKKVSTIWYQKPFKHPIDNRNLYSACKECRKLYSIV